ncbi:MAG: hypothetical protein DDT20_01030 [Firmicutes bacterium]|nr:hypothetical protein [Bacillota bacterium]
MFWMLLLKGGLPAYQALGERAYWIELLEYMMDRVVTHEPHRVLAMGISGLAAVEFAPDVSPITISPDIPMAPVPTNDIPPVQRPSRLPLIFIYHTHNSESFVPESGQPHVYNNPEQTIVRVGLALAHELEQLGASVIHSAEDHVRQAFDQSYTRSLQTLQRMLTKYPQIDFVFDVHRDGLPRSLTTTTWGQSVARVKIVVGRSEALGHLNWRRNHAFALALQQSLETVHAGFSRGILLREHGRFNQHLHPQTLLIEIGGHENTMGEVLRATRFLAQAVMALAPAR